MKKKSNPLSRRRFLLGSAALLVLGTSTSSFARVIPAIPAWQPGEVNLPEIFPSGKWYYLNDFEVKILGAIVECLIPADELSISGKEAGCVEFIDRQLAGSYGDFSHLYMQGPFKAGTPEQGDQSELTPRLRYRIGLKALDDYCLSNKQKAFADLSMAEREEVLKSLENGNISLDKIDAKLFFSIVLQNTMEGFFADPVYGGNKDMVSWRMLGFPGARYDYRGYIGKHNQKLEFEPVSMVGLLQHLPVNTQ